MSILRQIIDSAFQGTFSYADFKETVLRFAREGKTSGPNQSESMVHYTRLSAARMKRMDKTAVLAQETLQLVKEITEPLTFLVLTETWCADAVQTMPYVQKMAEANPNITLRFMWREEAPFLIDEFLTNGSKSIPKLIALDASNNVLFTWGPRPEPAQQMVMEYRSRPEPKPAYIDFYKTLFAWYMADKGETFQREFRALLKKVPVQG